MRATHTFEGVPTYHDEHRAELTDELLAALPDKELLDLVEEIEQDPKDPGTFTVHFLWTGQVDACEDTYEQAALEAMQDDGYPTDHFTCDHDYSEFQGTER
ncbi:hypothetical protein B842_03470 [Corynebacterium humireducens NBRC 106098 = DSM 45392]|uniref:Uncharacterized protein n=2 Tax=Corynebacterium humireducens TaxID=1223514 RepID=A0A0B5D5Z9_9CORY|nr:hypothetical protein B842_03470 [Corynebacterium humireducens NBRC 106098 = DSM 45392]